MMLSVAQIFHKITFSEVLNLDISRDDHLSSFMSFAVITSPNIHLWISGR